ncbi:hypothetical protein BBJ28_00021420 [Nothophytophthora sp. Chile5]|nr:hypothetical protein BBJ28_00021420 [Nothophytophthora sp. Chile5]
MKKNVVSSPRRSLLDSAVVPPRESAGYLDMTALTIDSQPRRSLRRSNVSEESDHRSRFLSDAERVLAEHPQEARQSFAEVEAQDAKMWALMPTDVIAKQLSTNLERGLDSTQLDRLRAEYGPNELEEDPRTPLHIIFLLQFYNLIIGMLLFAAVASLALQEWVEGIAILFIVTLNAVIATIQENSAGNALEALAKMSSPQSTVVRDGTQQMVDSKELLPGDIVLLVTGDVVPSDIRLHHSVDLKANEMLLTGESEDVSKKYNASMSGKSDKLTATNMVFSSTTITTGNARGIVVETGMSTRVGSIAMLLQSRSENEEKQGFQNPITKFLDKHQPKLTPLQRALHKLGFVMGTIALRVCALVFLVGMVRGTRDAKHPERPVWLTMVMISVSLAVSAVPEGLPMVVTICLSTGTSDMVKKNVLVRKLAAVETLGAASVICTDKTGTLTEGKMTAVKLWSDFKEYDITGKGFTPEGAILLNGANVTAPSSSNVQVRSTLLASVCCSNTHLKQVDVDGVATWQPFGNSSEAPLVVAAAKAGIWEDYVMEEYKRVVEVPFSSSRKMMVTVHALPPTGMFGTLALNPKTKFVACVKGAPNYILDNCTRFCQADGVMSSLSNAQRKEITSAVDNLSSQALRVLAVAINPLPEIPFSTDCDDIEEKFSTLSQPLVFLGLIASIDPERDGVREAISNARMASIRTVMITGDYLKTAVAIAKNIDLLQVGADPDEEATDCVQLRPRGSGYLPEPDLDEITSRTLVFARAKPEDKIEIVKSLQRQGLIAAMTGDGVNDAPALKEADIGVAMGIAGTEVAKGASDMILTDDNFVSIVAAVEKGRIIYANIQKFVIFLLSTNIGEILLIFSTIAAGCPLPLEALQILILNLFSDGMPAVALSMEKGDPNIMEDRPRPKQQHLIHGRLWLLVGYNAVLIASGAIAAFLLGVYWNFGYVLLDDIYAQGGGSHGTDYSDVTCTRWEGINAGWKLYGNCAAQNADGSYIFGEDISGSDVFENATMYCEGGDYDCLPEGLARSQTMSFICITFTEVLRAFTVRSFTEPVFVGIFANKFMWFAAVLSVCLTIFVTNVPVVMDDIFGFAYISWFQWLVSCAGAVNAAFWGEILKLCIRRRDREQARWDSMREGFESVLLEIRHVRHHVERLENLPNWVSPIAATDSACYRKTYLSSETCATGYASDGIATCWAQCPLAYPVECGMECIPQNADCTLEVIDKVTSVATVALNAATAGVFGELSKASKAVQLGVKCGQKLFSVTTSLVDFVEEQKTDSPDTTEDELMVLLDQSDLVIDELPTAVSTCLGLDLPTDKLELSSEVTDVINQILTQVVENGTALLDPDTFLALLSDVGADDSVQELDSDGLTQLQDIITAGTTCGTELQTIIDKVTQLVADMKDTNPSSTVSNIRQVLSVSELFLTGIPAVTNDCIRNVTDDAYATRDSLRTVMGVITDNLVDSSDNSTGDAVSTADYLLSVADMGLDVIATFDPTGIADMMATYIQPICGPTAFMGEIDDGSLADALALTAVEGAFHGSSGTWNKSGSGTVNITFESTDTDDVTVVIHSGGDTVAKVDVASGETVVWTSTVAELQDKTLYLDRWRPGLFGVPGSGGGSLLMWVPRASAGGNVALHALLNGADSSEGSDSGGSEGDDSEGDDSEGDDSEEESSGDGSEGDDVTPAPTALENGDATPAPTAVDDETDASMLLGKRGEKADVRIRITSKGGANLKVHVHGQQDQQLPIPTTMPELIVTLLKASNLPIADTFVQGSASDPFVTFLVGDECLRSSCINGSLDPVWQPAESFEFEVADASSAHLLVQVVDNDTFKQDDLLGELRLPLALFEKNPNASVVETYELTVADGLKAAAKKPDEKTTIQLDICLAVETDGQRTLCIWENEDWVDGAWKPSHSHERRHWSTHDLQISSDNFDQVAPTVPDGLEGGGWAYSTKKGDDHGWVYASTYTGPWASSSSPTCYARRRLWQNNCRPAVACE